MNGDGYLAVPYGSDEWRERGLAFVSRLFAVLRTARAYPVGNPVLAGQLAQLLDALAPVLEGRETVCLAVRGGELHLDDTLLPVRAGTQRVLELVSQSLDEREIAGVRFHAGMTHVELTEFMRYFLASTAYKGRELAEACRIAHVRRIEAVLADELAPAAPAAAAPAAIADDAGAAAWPAAVLDGLDAWERAVHDAHVLLGHGGREVEARHLKRVVLPLVDAALAGSALTAGLADPGFQRPNGWLFGLRTAIVAVAMGRHLGLARADLVDAGIVALLQDGADGRARGPAEAFAHLARLAPLSPATLAAMRLAVTPAAAAAVPEPSPLAALVRLAAWYVALESEAGADGPARTPGQALATLLGPLAPAHDTAVRAALVRAVGCHPPGQAVELEDGTPARVVAANPDDPERPYVAALASHAGEAPGPPAIGVVVRERTADDAPRRAA